MYGHQTNLNTSFLKENRKSYDQSVAEALNAEKAWSELNDLLRQLQTKIAEAANTIRLDIQKAIILVSVFDVNNSFGTDVAVAVCAIHGNQPEDHISLLDNATHAKFDTLLEK